MEIQDILVLIALSVLIAYDVVDFFKFQNNLQAYGHKKSETRCKEKYPQNNLKEYLPPARKHDKIDIITSTRRVFPKSPKIKDG